MNDEQDDLSERKVKKTERVTFAISPEDKKLLKQRAKTLRMSVAAYVRLYIFKPELPGNRSGLNVTVNNNLDISIDSESSKKSFEEYRKLRDSRKVFYDERLAEIPGSDIHYIGSIEALEPGSVNTHILLIREIKERIKKRSSMDKKIRVVDAKDMRLYKGDNNEAI